MRTAARSGWASGTQERMLLVEQSEEMELLAQLEEQLAGERPVKWENLPDIPLYMDQVVSYLGRQLIGFGRGDTLTPAMINNYIKDGLAPRAQGKKYDREHLVYLTLVAAVKQVLSVRDMTVLFQSVDQPVEPQALYGTFQEDLDLALKETLEHIRSAPDRDNLPALALSLALRSYADALACRRIVELLRPEEKKTRKHKDEEAAP